RSKFNLASKLFLSIHALRRSSSKQLLARLKSMFDAIKMLLAARCTCWCFPLTTLIRLYKLLKNNSRSFDRDWQTSEELSFR
ncbi:hypothetical protein Q6332_27845, partial [Klebsiella pneumoniae]|uniref:hypothetical protein n=1 Tax=Klebsiella pneumoniae TaxID=573 RepID=UPI002730A630